MSSSPKCPPPADLGRGPALNVPRRLEYMPLDEIRGASRNAKRHAGELSASLKRFGTVAPPILDERTGRLVAGHGRVEHLLLLKEAGERAPEGVVVRKGRWLVPVVRGWQSANDGEAEAYSIADNQLAILGGWDDATLAAMIADLEQRDAMDGLGFDFDELQARGFFDSLGGGDPAPDAPGPDPEAEPPPDAGPSTTRQARREDPVPDVRPEDVNVRPGQLFKLGEHRLLIGDSFNPEHRARLLSLGDVLVELAAILTDPPYAIYGSSSGIAADIADDAMVLPFFEAFFKLCMEHVRKFGHIYTFCDWRSWATIWEGSRRAGTVAKNMLVWDKLGAGLGSNYANTHELIFFGARLPKQTAMGHRESGQRTVHKPNMVRVAHPQEVPAEALAGLPQPLQEFFRKLVVCCPVELFWEMLAVARDPNPTPESIFRHTRVTGQERLHNAAKPVPLLMDLLEASTDKGDPVGEFFAGSGSTIIACEQTGRRCFAMEMNPRNAQTSIRRWERFTGRTAELMP